MNDGRICRERTACVKVGVRVCWPALTVKIEKQSDLFLNRHVHGPNHRPSSN